MTDPLPLAHIVHMSSGHPPFEPRIFLKECRSLRRHGYAVSLVTPGTVTGEQEGICLVPVAAPRSRLHRLLVVAPRVAWRAWRLRPDLYHLHDTMLLPWAILLRLATGRPVVYDVHEDFVTAIRYKPYLPAWLGRLLGQAYGGTEQLAARLLEIIIAERYYARRFPCSTEVLNYPAEETFADLVQVGRRFADGEPIRLLYTGSVSVLRGAETMARLSCALPTDSEIWIVGRCDPEVAAAIRAIQPDEMRLRLVGVGRQLPYEEILAYYRQPWTAALALFPDNPHTREKEPTKLFEYMAAGLPVVGSDFPVWRDLLAGLGAGLCVDVGDATLTAREIVALAADPERLAAMSQAGREAVGTRYRWASQEANLLRLYRRCLSRADDVRPAATRSAS